MTLRAHHTNLPLLLKVAEWVLLMLISLVIVLGIWAILPFPAGSISGIIVLQALQTIALFVVPALLVAYLWSDHPRTLLHLPAQRLDGITAILCICLTISIIPVSNALLYWSSNVPFPSFLSGLHERIAADEERAAALLESIMRFRDGAWWMLIINLVVLAILPSIGEELTFRGILQSFFKPSHTAVWLTAAIFSFVHWQFYGFLSRMLLGAIFGYIVWWTGHLGYSMVMHCTNNMLSVLLFYANTYIWHLPEDTLEYLGTGNTWWLTAISIPLSAILTAVLYKRTHPAYTPRIEYIQSQ